MTFLDRFIGACARRPGLLGLAYHRIGESRDQPFDDELFSATAAQFRAQLVHLRAHFDILTADALLASLGDGRLTLSRPSAIITFDDGYRDNCEIALPILRSLGIPAVFFVAAGYIDEPELTWWDRVAFIIKHTDRTRLTLDYPTGATFDLSEIGRLRAIQQILRLYKRTPEIDQRQFFGHLEERAGVGIDASPAGQQLFMTWDHVRTLGNAGMEIGGHTYSHPVLARLPEHAQEHELRRAKERLEVETGQEVRLLAYPVGGRDAFTDRTKQLARTVGYRAGFSYYGGFNRPAQTDAFDILRIPVERYDTLRSFAVRASATNVLGRAL